LDDVDRPRRLKIERPGIRSNVGARRGTVDAHGCRFRAKDRVNTGGGKSLLGVAFEAFPRGEPSFDYLLCDSSGKVLTQFNVANPRLTKPQEWIPENMPITKTNAGLVAQLRQLWRSDSPFPPDVWLVSTLDQDLWQKGPVWNYDRFGNRSLFFGSHAGFCTNERIVKIEAHFFRRARANFRPDEIWTISNVAIPASRRVVDVQQTNRLQGCELVIEALEGADAAPPRLRVRCTQWSGEAKVLARARDNLGRNLVTRADDDLSVTFTRHQAFGIHTFADSKSLDIEVLVQQSTKFEFFVEPPR
jgi:hypothetical protein